MRTNARTTKPRFGTKISRRAKRNAGRTGIAQTPLAIRTTGIAISDAIREHIQRKLTAKLGALAKRIERISVRIEDLNGPKGGVDKVCRVKVVLVGLPSVIHESSARDVRSAIDLAAGGIDRTLRRELDRAHTLGRIGRLGRKRKPAAESETSRTEIERPPNAPPAEGSLIGRRVGQGTKNLEAALERPEKERRDAYVDTSLPNVSASDRRAGGGSTARRNTKRKHTRATAALEDSAKGRPSRKSTRKSANRGKRDSNLKRRQTRATTSPRARAARARARNA